MRRRTWLAAAAGAGVALAGRAAEAPGAGEEGAVSANEDLMREHALLARMLRLYDEAVRRIDAGEAVPVDILSPTAAAVRKFIEDYHERNEEQYVFPPLAAAGMGPLVALLKKQHDAGRALTTAVLEMTRGPVPAGDRPRLRAWLHAYVRMYRPHKAREGTVVFPALHAALGPKGYRELGEQLEETEERMFPTGGFEAYVRRVAELETVAGIEDLAQYTPSPPSAYEEKE